MNSEVLNQANPSKHSVLAGPKFPWHGIGLFMVVDGPSETRMAS